MRSSCTVLTLAVVALGLSPARVEAGTISIPDDPELVAELSTIQYTYTSKGLIQLEPKEQLKKRLKRSPDKADALVLAYYDAGSGLLIGVG